MCVAPGLFGCAVGGWSVCAGQSEPRPPERGGIDVGEELVCRGVEVPLAAGGGPGARPGASPDRGWVAASAVGARACCDYSLGGDAEASPHRFGSYNNCPAHGFPLVRYPLAAVIIDGAQRLNGQFG